MCMQRENAPKNIIKKKNEAKAVSRDYCPKNLQKSITK